MMKSIATSNLFSGPLAALLLASAMGIPGLAQEAKPAANPEAAQPPVTQTQPDTSLQQQTTSSNVPAASKEGFWGRVNPFARKKWVKRQTDPINDRLSELDEVNAKNAKDIQDVDHRAQTGINQAQTSAEAANQKATSAFATAQQAAATVRDADGHLTQLDGKVDGIDQYRMITTAEIRFRSGQPVLSAEARKKLDELAESVAGQHGYILELEARSPLGGSAGIQNSARLGEAVKRYLVTKHEIPVYRLHTVALGNARNADATETKTAPSSSVRVQLMLNSLASEQAVPPTGMAMSGSTEQR